jgi:hypothetical protein
MYRELIQRTSLIDLPIYALVLFVVVFAVLTVRVLLKNDFAEVAALPLSDDEEVSHGK